DMAVGIGRQRESARESGPVEDEGDRRQPRHVRDRVEMIVEEILDPLIDRTQVAGERAILFTTESEEVVDERCQAVAGRGIRVDARLADFAQLEIEVGDELSGGG